MVKARRREALARTEELAAAEPAVRDVQIAALAAQVEELRRRLGEDSSTSSRPPSPDGPYLSARAGAPAVTGSRCITAMCWALVFVRG